ncbi:MAG: thioredoxin [Chthonomonadaceae bacterium]|nr:thioredoxin [Chthonomonadaceae bacterium]
MSSAATLTTATFDDEVTKSTIPVLVDFWAVWCGPCRQIAPTVDELATEYAGRVKVMKVNVDEEGELAQRFGVMSIPTLIIFKDGKPADQIMGALPKATIVGRLEKVL